MIWTEHKDYQLGQILYDVGHCLCVLQIKMGPQWETFVAVDFLNIIFTTGWTACRLLLHIYT